MKKKSNNTTMPKKLVKEIVEWVKDFERTNPENWIIAGDTFEEDAYLLFNKILAWHNEQLK